MDKLGIILIASTILALLAALAYYIWRKWGNRYFSKTKVNIGDWIGARPLCTMQAWNGSIDNPARLFMWGKVIENKLEEKVDGIMTPVPNVAAIEWRHIARMNWKVFGASNKADSWVTMYLGSVTDPPGVWNGHDIDKGPVRQSKDSKGNPITIGSNNYQAARVWPGHIVYIPHYALIKEEDVPNDDDTTFKNFSLPK